MQNKGKERYFSVGVGRGIRGFTIVKFLGHETDQFPWIYSGAPRPGNFDRLSH